MSRKRIFSIIGLLFFMWASVAGQYVTILDDFGKACLAGLVDTIIITCIMMVIPFIFRLIFNGRIEYSRGRKICKYNSIALFIASILLTVAVTDGNNFVGIGGLGAVMFYYINKWLFVEELEVDLDDAEYEEKNDSQIIKNAKIVEDIEDADVQIVEKRFFTNKNILIIILGILCLIFVGMTIYYYSSYQRMIDATAESVSYGADCQVDLDELLDDHTQYYVKDKLDFFDENIVFVLDGYEEHYYTYDCVQKITNGEEYSYWAYNKEQAISLGYSKGYCY